MKKAMLSTLAWAAFAFAAAGAVQAHDHGEQWTLANEYPANSLSGEGDAYFARLVAQKSQGKLSIVAMPDAKLGYKSREQLRAVADGRLAMADSFGGALGDEHPLFGLASLPFVAADVVTRDHPAGQLVLVIDLVYRGRRTCGATSRGLNARFAQ